MSTATRDLVIVGAGGHGRELFDAVLAVNRVRPTWRVLGVVDDDPQHTDRLERIGLELLGPIERLLELGCAYALGIGTSEVRQRLAARFDAAGLEPATVVHPGAHLGSDVELGPGAVVFDRCTLTTHVRIGAHTHLNVGCAVQHDSVLGDAVQVSPGVFVNGDCRIGDAVFLGTGAIVTRGTTVGERARVGAGAVVLDDVAPGSTVVGVPAAPTATHT